MQSARRREHHVAPLQRLLATDVDEADGTARPLGRRCRGLRHGGVDVVRVDLDASGIDAVEHDYVAQRRRGYEDLVDAGEHHRESSGPLVAPGGGAGAVTLASDAIERAWSELSVDEEQPGAPPPQVVHRHHGHDAAGGGLGEKVGP